MVLLAHQVTDAARLLIFAIAAASAVPVLAMLGGMAGCGLGIALGWGASDALLRAPLGKIRAGLGMVLAAAALYLVL